MIEELVDPVPLRTNFELDEEDIEAAQIAWKYFEANTQPQSGFVNSVDGFPSTTIWDQGSYVLALVAAEKLRIISSDKFYSRMSKFLVSLSELELFEGKLPNKAYNTATLAMSTYSNEVSQDGIGWSALDVGRLLSALHVVRLAYPDLSEKISQAIRLWDLGSFAIHGELIGTSRANGETLFLQEGRIGYEQYAARASAFWGLDVSHSASSIRVLDWETVAGVAVPIDSRSHTTFGAINPTLSEPYFLQGLEYGFDREGHLLASAVYRAQIARYQNTGQLTMVSEDHLDRAPYFAYSAVFSNGSSWAVLNEEGEDFSELRTISTKTAFAWNALFDDQYSNAVLSDLGPIYGPRGWFSGRYEVSGEINVSTSLNTNAVILQSIYYKRSGKLLMR